ncbi:FAD/NAD(P)-binding domain-containing protein [Roridomyces roridus]|uniref:FAD/NAD(P)-binding domain-containing protein n=1 Tax=Roridomyces roridus TaxID=1738132 RepID=A0AAD7BM92_9AGAR|nr:FAD/NAD(P)-binding domain-containing protein [Roridomyces roridus]
MSPTSNNSSSQPLTISIVGAGIGGLTAAVALRRNGHTVQIFEAADLKTEIGAGLGVQANALKVYDHIGLCRENLHGIPWQATVRMSSDCQERTICPWFVPGLTTNGLLCHRIDLHEELKRLAIGEGQGPPAILHPATKVIACDPEAGTITLQGGETVHADAVLGADGIHSVVRDHVVQDVLRPEDTGFSCFRAVVDASNVRDIPELEWVYGEVSGMRNIPGKDGSLLVVYPCRDGTLINIVAFYSDISDATAGWSGHATVDEFKTVFHEFHPKFLNLLDLPLHSPIHKWKLRVLPLLPTWVRGRTALLGDAAHATIPHLGQGAGMSIEDGGAIGCLLPAGTRAEDVPACLKAYEELRKERGEFIRAESVDQMVRGFDLYKNKELQMKILGYDPIRAVQQFYQEQFGGVH